MSNKVHEIAGRGLRRLYRVPTPQRDLVWENKKKIRMYATLLKGYSPGLMWTWREDRHDEHEMILDGMQRLAALLLLFGIAPPTHEGQDDKPTDTKVQFDPDTSTFRIVPRSERAVDADFPQTEGKPTRWVDTEVLLPLTEGEARDKINKLVSHMPKSARNNDELRDRRKDALLSLHRIADVDIHVTQFRGTLPEVIELFVDINQGSEKMRREDLVLSIISGHAGTWRNDQFMPLLAELEAAGFTVGKRNVLLTLGSLWKGDPTLTPVGRDNSEWAELVTAGTAGHRAWEDTKRAWLQAAGYLRRHGITSEKLLPNTSALIALVALIGRFPDVLSSSRAIGWLHATGLVGRYGSGSNKTQKHDVIAVACAQNSREALDELIALTGYGEGYALTADHLCAAATPPLRSLVWSAVHARGARDWMSGQRLSHENALEVHHIFPKQLKRQGQLGEVDCLANYAWLEAPTNNKLSDLTPEKSLTRPDIRTETLRDQWIWEDQALRQVTRYTEATRRRGERMAADINTWIEGLLAAPHATPASGAENVDEQAETPPGQDLEPLHLNGRGREDSPEWLPGTVLALRSLPRARVRVSEDGQLVLSAGSPVVGSPKKTLNGPVREGLEKLRAAGDLGRDVGGGRVELLRPVTAPTLGPIGLLCSGYPQSTSSWKVMSGPGAATPSDESDLQDDPDLFM